MYLHPKDIEDLYASIHRLAQKHVPGCTIEQVRKIANRFHDEKTTRLQYAFILYWELSEERVEESYADSFMRQLHKLVENATKRAQERKRSAEKIRNYWQS